MPEARDLSKMVLPIGAAIAAGIAVVGISVAYGSITKQVEINTINIAATQIELRNVPTRLEFDEVKNNIKEIKDGVAKLTESLLRK